MMEASTGRAIGQAAHIGQSIADILTTPIGSRLMRRLYGSYLPALVDQPATPANILRLKAATAQAIIKWEPRTRVSRIGVAVTAAGNVEISIERKDRGQAAIERQTIRMGGAAA